MQRILDDDIVTIRRRDDPKQIAATLFWGDVVTVAGQQGGQAIVELPRHRFNALTGVVSEDMTEGLLPAKAKFRDESLLKVRFVDVGQGDGAILETPGGKRIFIDGGAGNDMRNYVGAAYGYVLKDGPLHCDAIVVTHGDADHFAGLTKILLTSRAGGELFATADRVYHNGLIKTGARGKKAFGETKKVGSDTFVVDLYNDLTKVADTKMSAGFRDWKKALKRLKEANPVKVARLEYGADDAFGFLDPDIGVRVLGPVVGEAAGKPALRFLHKPGTKSLSDSHTINGHSVVLKLSYGNVRFLFGADLNEESEESLLTRAGQDAISLAAEVLKVPHHGSADFSPAILEAIRPVVSVISSGDESVMTEYIHPRAGLVGALGRASRESVAKPLIYVTEMVAFFQRLGAVRAKGGGDLTANGRTIGEAVYNAYRKTAFGIVHVRTDGQRVLVATHSGKVGEKESYAFRVDPLGNVEFEEPSILKK